MKVSVWGASLRALWHMNAAGGSTITKDEVLTFHVAFTS